jgi:hypothetical protein
VVVLATYFPTAPKKAFETPPQNTLAFLATGVTVEGDPDNKIVSTPISGLVCAPSNQKNGDVKVDLK